MMETKVWKPTCGHHLLQRSDSSEPEFGKFPKLDLSWTCPKQAIQTLKDAVTEVIKDQKIADTPVLTEVVSRENLILTKIDNVSLLQRLAAEVENKRLQYLTTPAVEVTPALLEGGNIPDVTLKAVARVYLNGNGKARGQSVSVSVSLQGQDESCDSMERSIIVSCYLFKGSKHYRRSFTMKRSKEVSHKGIVDFISQKELGDYVDKKDDSVVLGIQVLFGPL